MSLKPEIAAVLAKHKVERFEVVERENDTVLLRTVEPVSVNVLYELGKLTGSQWINSKLIFPPPPPPAPEKLDKAVKHDTDKPRMGLISSRFLRGLARVLTFGAGKYAAHNWRKGFVHSRVYDELQRHLVDWNDGVDVDSDSGLPTLYHAACELMFLAELAETHPELDDRHKPNPARVAANESLKTVAAEPLTPTMAGDWFQVELENGQEVFAFVPKHAPGIPGALPTSFHAKV